MPALQSPSSDASLIIAVVAVLLTTLLVWQQFCHQPEWSVPFAGMLYPEVIWPVSVARIGPNSRNVGKAQLLVILWFGSGCQPVCSPGTSFQY